MNLVVNLYHMTINLLLLGYLLVLNTLFFKSIDFSLPFTQFPVFICLALDVAHQAFKSLLVLFDELWLVSIFDNVVFSIDFQSQLICISALVPVYPLYYAQRQNLSKDLYQAHRAKEHVLLINHFINAARVNHNKVTQRLMNRQQLVCLSYIGSKLPYLLNQSVNAKVQQCATIAQDQASPDLTCQCKNEYTYQTRSIAQSFDIKIPNEAGVYIRVSKQEF